jgi:hypothetical protein
VAGGNECDGPLHDRDNIEPTRLEKVLLAKERDLTDSRVLRVVSQDDEMWTSGMQATSEYDSMDESEYSNEEEDE